MPTLKKGRFLNQQSNFTTQGTQKKEGLTKPSVSRRKEITKNKNQWNRRYKNQWNKNLFFGKMNKIDKFLATLRKKNTK